MIKFREIVSYMNKYNTNNVLIKHFLAYFVNICSIKKNKRFFY